MSSPVTVLLQGWWQRWQAQKSDSGVPSTKRTSVDSQRGHLGWCVSVVGQSVERRPPRQ